ncbi:phage baseplate hub [Photobacterium aphoticum]|uniref:Phage baseplate hub n=1 Tax=Photobacterium aphoticum TaxID=754436 RepID=A0A090QXK4_9GAMM|nr:phage baseplate hub [Photobacterium aphoticum]
MDFPRSGDTRYPRITGSCYYAPDYKSHLPAGQPGKAAEGEPPAPEITLKDDLYSRFGISEYKTHTGAWGIVHVATGTRLEISEAGIVIHSEKDSFRSSTGKTVEKIGGDYEQSVKGAVKIAIDGAAELSASAITLKSGGAVSIEAGGAFNVKATKADFKLG